MQPIYENGKLVQGKCPHCLEIFAATRSSGTSHMRRHLLACEPRGKMHEIVGKLQASVVSTESTVQTDWKYDPIVTRKELVRLLILHELPFSFVEYKGFRSYSASLSPLYEPVSITTIKENCMEAYKNHRSTLRDFIGKFKCRISLTVDFCTTNQTMDYICITAHYIDSEWKVQKRIIRFCTIEKPHDAFNIYNVILKSIRYYNIEDKLFSITLDNAPLNKTMMDLLVANLSSKKMLLCDGNLFHVRCAAHVLNVIVNDALKAIDGVINDVRESVKYIEGSESRKEKFEEIISELGISGQHHLSLDVALHWNSTFDMLEAALSLRDAFYQLGRQDSNYKHCPSTQSWAIADVICNMLKAFKTAAEIFSDLAHPTSNLYFHQIWNVRQVLDNAISCANPTVVTFVKGMKTEFEKYWEISYLTYCIPVILDPRFKFGLIDFRLNQAFQEYGGYHIAKVDEALRSLFAGYSSQIEDNANHFTQGNGNVAAQKSKPWSDWSHHMSAQKNQSKPWSDWSHHMNEQKNPVTSELDRYLRDDLFPCDDDDFDILHWWKMHSSKYPTLARMACDVLAVPASTVPSQFTFSTSGRIINDYMTRLSGNTIEALICFQDWLTAAGAILCHCFYLSHKSLLLHFVFHLTMRS